MSRPDFVAYSCFDAEARLPSYHPSMVITPLSPLALSPLALSPLALSPLALSPLALSPLVCYSCFDPNQA